MGWEAERTRKGQCAMVFIEGVLIGLMIGATVGFMAHALMFMAD